jgi:hypothetical protein
MKLPDAHQPLRFPNDVVALDNFRAIYRSRRVSRRAFFKPLVQDAAN